MSKRKAVRFAVRCTVFAAVCGSTAIALAGFSAFAMRSSRALPFDETLTSADDRAEPQMANRAAKANRLSLLLPVALAPADRHGFMLASAPQSTDLDRFYDTVTAAVPMLAQPEPQAEAALAAETPAPAVVAAPPPAVVAAVPAEKPKRVAPPAPPAPSNMLDDGAIAGLKSRLRLTSDQIEYWPAVESALRDVARTQLRHSARQASTGRVNIDVNSSEVQSLIWAAMPLLMRLRADQKNEVRKLARIMGLEQVASQI